MTERIRQIYPVATQQDSIEQDRLLRRVFSRRSLKRLAAVIALALLIGLVARNAIVRRIGILVGSRILSTQVDIGDVDIRWSAISFSEIAVYEPKIANAKQLSVKQVDIVPCLWRGLQTGVWFSKVVIVEPTAEIRFDRDGKMLSIFPDTSGENESTGPLKIPFANVIIDAAALIIHQAGRDSLHVQDVDVALLAGKRIKAKVTIPSLIGGQLQLQCDVDAVTFAGETRISLEHLHTDTRICEATTCAAGDRSRADHSRLRFPNTRTASRQRTRPSQAQLPAQCCDIERLL